MVAPNARMMVNRILFMNRELIIKWWPDLRAFEGKNTRAQSGGQEKDIPPISTKGG
jgi:hypothetical protein